MTRVPHRLLVIVAALVAAYAGVHLGVSLLSDDLGTDMLLAIGGMAVFTTVGALIEDHRPGNVVGRICLAVGLLLVASTILRAFAQVLDAEPGPLPVVGALAAWASSYSFTSAIFLGQMLILSRFPDGRLVGRLGRATDAVILLSLATVILQALRPGRLEFGWIRPVPNPLGQAALGPILDRTSSLGFLMYAAALLGGLAVLVVRYRRGSPVTRAQIRWLMAAIGVSGALLVVLLTDLLGETGWSAWLLSTLLTPIAIGVAILRYRLYEIDRIISRTIGYAIVTAVLGAVFLGTNLGLGTLVATATGGSTLAVAASTLLVAALFQPLRRAVQAPVDRRFNRARVDAERTLEAFGERVREEVDLERLAGETRRAAIGAVQPAAAVLWLRPGQGGR